jgi:hypothetical protein
MRPQSMQSTHLRLGLKALAISAVLNCVVVLMSIAGGRSVLGRFADAIAAPPGVVINRIVQPREHSTGAFVVAAAGSLAISVLFYARLLRWSSSRQSTVIA